MERRIFRLGVSLPARSGVPAGQYKARRLTILTLRDTLCQHRESIFAYILPYNTQHGHRVRIGRPRMRIGIASRTVDIIMPLAAFLPNSTRPFFCSWAAAHFPSEWMACISLAPQRRMRCPHQRKVCITDRRTCILSSGGACVPVDASVFKIDGRRRRAGVGGFDSHAFP